MADDPAGDNPTDEPVDADPAAPAPSRPASRAARRKVDLPASRSAAGATSGSGADDPAAASDRPAGTPSKRPGKPPLYRRGGFWFWVIVAEVAVALFLSYRFEPSLDTVDPAGADVPAFCASVAGYRAAASAALTVDVVDTPAEFDREVEAYRQLRTQGPTELQPDFDKLIVVTSGLAVEARAIVAHRKSDPTYLGAIEDLSRAREAADARLATSNQRLVVAVKSLCNIDLNALAPSVPGTTGPAGGPGGSVVPPGGTAPTTVPGPSGSSAPTTVGPVTTPVAPGGPDTTVGIR